MYSGNLGLYYDLENLMTVIKKFSERNNVAFVFIGEGSVKEALIAYKEEFKLKNVFFIPYQDKAELIYSLNAGDAHWCINANGIKGVSVPSKLYGIMAAGKPIIGLLESGSEARLIIEESKCGYVIEPGNYSGSEDILENLIKKHGSQELIEMGQRGRTFLVKKLTKKLSVEKYITEIEKCRR